MIFAKQRRSQNDKGFEKGLAYSQPNCRIPREMSSARSCKPFGQEKGRGQSKVSMRGRRDGSFELEGQKGHMQPWPCTRLFTLTNQCVLLKP